MGAVPTKYERLLEMLIESNMFYMACGELISADTNIDKESIEKHLTMAKGLLREAPNVEGVTEEMKNFLKESIALLTKELEPLSSEE